MSPPPAIAAGDKVTETRYTLAGRAKLTVTPGPDDAAFDWGSADSAKSITEVFYDGAGRQTRVRDPRGKDTTTTYDPAGRVDVVTSPTGAWVDYTYDAAGQVTGITRPSGLASPATVTESRTYQANGWLKTQTAAGATAATEYAYTPGGQVDIVKDPLGAMVEYSYDEFGRVKQRKSLVDSAAVDDWVWDAAGNLKSHTVPAVATGGDRQTTTYSYDYDDADPANDYGRLVSITDPTGRVETRSYYESGDLKTQTYTASGLPTITSARTLNGRGWLTSLVDTTGTATRTTSYEMDRAGNRVRQSSPDGNLDYKWDLAGNLTELIYPDGAKFAYTHLKTGQINEFKSWFAAWSTFVLIANYTYDDDGAESAEWIFGAGGNSGVRPRRTAVDSISISPALVDPRTWRSSSTWVPTRDSGSDTSRR